MIYQKFEICHSKSIMKIQFEGTNYQQIGIFSYGGIPNRLKKRDFLLIPDSIRPNRTGVFVDPCRSIWINEHKPLSNMV